SPEHRPDRRRREQRVGPDRQRERRGREGLLRHPAHDPARPHGDQQRRLGTTRPADQELLAQAALQSSRDHRAAWAEAITAAEEEAEAMGVEFVEDVDLDAFRAATRPVLESFSAEYPE